jgi:hypothetical protein
MALVLTAGGLSLAMNVTAGLGVGIALAVAFGLSDVTKVIMPIVCEAIGWDSFSKWLYRAASVISVICAVLFLADQFGADIAGKENAAAIVSNADQRIDDLREQLKTTQAEQSALLGQRASAAVQADIEAAKQHKRWDSTKGCTDATLPDSREFCKEFHALGAELATAQKAERLSDQVVELQRQLSTATVKRETAPAETVDGKATVIASLVGTSESQTSRSIAMVLIIAALIISEMVVHASGKAAAMLGAAMAPRNVAKPVTASDKAAKAVAKLKADIAKPAKTVANRDYYIARLEREFPHIAARVANKELSVYAACVAAGLRKAPKKPPQWTKIESYATSQTAGV